MVQAKGILGVAPGSFVAIDGTSGDVIITPSGTDTAALAERSRRRAAALAGSTGSAEHNHRVALLANIGTVADAAAASGLDLEGCGLLRTEFLFVDRESAPTVTEQAEMYAGVLRRSGAAAWSALGCRGLRLSMAREDLLDGCDLWVMAPMVATQEEAEWFVRRARSFGLPQVGVMVETPAAALTAEQLLSAADFASIGTNDLL